MSRFWPQQNEDSFDSNRLFDSIIFISDMTRIILELEFIISGLHNDGAVYNRHCCYRLLWSGLNPKPSLVLVIVCDEHVKNKAVEKSLHNRLLLPALTTFLLFHQWYAPSLYIFRFPSASIYRFQIFFFVLASSVMICLSYRWKNTLLFLT